MLADVGSDVDDFGFSYSFCGRGEEGVCSVAVVVVHCDGWCRCDLHFGCLLVVDVVVGWDLLGGCNGTPGCWSFLMW